jgi:YHS domain-containing protein
MFCTKTVSIGIFSPFTGLKSVYSPALLTLFILLTSQVSMGSGCPPVSKHGIIFNGHDIVSYVDNQKTVPGDRKYKAMVDNIIYLFASQENRELFLRAVEKYTDALHKGCPENE